MNRHRRFTAVVIGASAGGINAVQRLLRGLPPDYALPTLLVQHLRTGMPIDFHTVLQPQPGLTVLEADEKARVAPRTLYVAPPGYHLLVERDYTLSLSVDEVVNYSRPSIDVLFESAAEVFGEALVAVVLTGANEDGAKGLKAVQRSGGFTIVQDPADAEVATMPEAAIRAVGTPDRILTAHAIGELLGTFVSGDLE